VTESFQDRTAQAARLLGDQCDQAVVLAPFTTFRIGGPADLLIRPRSLDQLVSMAQTLEPLDLPFLVIGQGSNLLVADEGIRGVVVVLDGGDFASWSADGDVVTAGAAMKMPILARQCAQRGLAGLEWMVGVPGSIGGAVCMNAGGHGSDVDTNLIAATVVDLTTGTLRVRSKSSLALSYRHSALRSSEVVTSALFQCVAGDPAALDDEISAIVRWRREHQPGGANCGSVFRNPPGDSAGRLIDAAALRGMEQGTAHVSLKHANFIQAAEHATARDVWALIIEVRRRVFETFGVVLQPEVRTVGFDANLPSLNEPPNP
jgi:UDP-N-acetylmuramate dehydrogenase